MRNLTVQVTGSGLGNQIRHDFQLFIIHGVNNILDCLIVIHIVFSFIFIIFRVISMRQDMTVVIAHRDIGFVHQRFDVVSVSDYRIGNLCAHVGSREHKAHFLNRAVKYVSALLLQLICPDRKGCNISVFYITLSGLSQVAVVKVAVNKNALRPVLKKTMSENCLRAFVVVSPHKRNLGSVLMGKRTASNCAAVTASEIIPSGPAAEIIAFILCHDSHDLLYYYELLPF